MRAVHFLPKLALSTAVLVSAWMATAQNSSVPPATREQSPGPEARLKDVDQRLGPFSIAGESFIVVLHSKRLQNASDPRFAQTLASLEILGKSGSLLYRKELPVEVSASNFRQTVTAFAQLFVGKLGTGLLIHYYDQTAALPATESWQFFAPVNGKLSLFGKPSPIGEGIAGRPFMGAVAIGGNGAVPLTAPQELADLSAWTGNFYVYVPVRVAWTRGQLAQGARCFGMGDPGRMREQGCDMRVEASREPPTDEFTFVRLFSEAQEDMGIAQHVVVQRNSKVEILESRAITTWEGGDDRMWPRFSDIWLHVRIDNRDGWIHTEPDFAAIGLPSRSPAP